MSDDSQSNDRAESATYETKLEAQKSDADFVKSWLRAIELAERDMKPWHERAHEASEIYTLSGEQCENEFNIVYSNISTICPSVYNSLPVPDVRRRYNDGENPTAKTAAQIIERCLTFTIDGEHFNEAVESDVLDMNLVGRGMSRLQYEPVITQVPQTDPMTGAPAMGLDGQPVMESVITAQNLFLQHLPYRDVVHGAAKTWRDVPWMAYRHRMTKEQLQAISPELAEQVQMDCTVDGKAKKDEDDTSSIFKRAFVWEIWDKDEKRIIFIAPSYKEAALAIMPPPFNVDGFFPSPKPLYGVKLNGLVPKVPYDYYRKQAEELNRQTGRIRSLLKVLKWRGVYLNGLGTALSDIQNNDDGEFSPVDNANDLSGITGGLDKAIWMMPIDKLMSVIHELVAQREQTKQTIYEITGIADIMRGSTNASETLGAQQIKAQWGAMRLQAMQRDVQRYIRDFMRMMAEVISENFQPDVLQKVAGIEVMPDVLALLQDDVNRNYRIDVETDSTIKADVTRDQQNISNFVAGLAQFLPAVVPLVQQGAIPPELPIAMVKSFSRTFKLGREVEDMLDRLGQMPQQQPMMPQMGQMPQQGNVVPMLPQQQQVMA